MAKTSQVSKVRQSDLGSSYSSRRHQRVLMELCSAAWAHTCLGSVFLPPLLPLPGIVHPHYPPAGQDFLPSAQRSHKNSDLWACLITRGLKIKASCSGTKALCKAEVTIMAGEVLVHSLAAVRAQLCDLKLPSIKKLQEEYKKNHFTEKSKTFHTNQEDNRIFTPLKTNAIKIQTLCAWRSLQLQHSWNVQL